ncbi:MAG TPA: hypothetical protein VJT49_03890 [Amycolatopsis sp.]|uniref:hypothetical protein n=1 Tax=Amycolatopsis sp. TaxID=37632 RepID=UPI002B46D1E5|nr:hypothetical protein [Amycolatopsis sp.]HKS44252.1 hypothetical protein [Amycolatopsis sp.]
MSIDELETAQPPSVSERTRLGRWWRGFTGSLATGLVALALVVLAAGLVSALAGAPGPGAAPLTAHPVAAVLAVAAQRLADRRDGRLAAVAGLFVLADVVLVLVFFWWWP